MHHQTLLLLQSAHAALYAQCLIFRSNQPAVRAAQGAGGMTMKRKGKPNVPIGSRGGMNNARMAEEAMRAERDAAPGMPVFEIFCRTRRVPMWYPCGALAGDARSKVCACSTHNCSGITV
jgi:Family of unknown function (DUF6523)